MNNIYFFIYTHGNLDKVLREKVEHFVYIFVIYNPIYKHWTDNNAST